MDGNLTLPSGCLACISLPETLAECGQRIFRCSLSRLAPIDVPAVVVGCNGRSIGRQAKSTSKSNRFQIDVLADLDTWDLWSRRKPHVSSNAMVEPRTVIRHALFRKIINIVGIVDVDYSFLTVRVIYGLSLDCVLRRD